MNTSPLFKQLQEVSVQTLVLMGDLNLPDICWKGNTMRCKQTKFLWGVRNSFVIQVLDGPARGDTQLHLLLTNKGRAHWDRGNQLGCSGNEIVELKKILRGVMKESSRSWTSAYSGNNYVESHERRLFGVKELRKAQVCNESILQAQEQATLILRKTSRHTRRSVWLNWEPMMELQPKMAAYRKWKEGQATKEEFRNFPQVRRDGVRKARTQLQLRLVRDVRGNQNFYSYAGSKKLNTRNVGLFLSGVGHTSQYLCLSLRKRSQRPLNYVRGFKRRAGSSG
ncbi:uncharacterized protein LOC141916003 [Strix aluco]|uniref:uncharacterized protein LOC141916003 n=1 Tax=Strix aluco TaxID=111821 RepID=UPI003DA20B6C